MNEPDQLVGYHPQTGRRMYSQSGAGPTREFAGYHADTGRAMYYRPDDTPVVEPVATKKKQIKMYGLFGIIPPGDTGTLTGVPEFSIQPTRLIINSVRIPARERAIEIVKHLAIAEEYQLALLARRNEHSDLARPTDYDTAKADVMAATRYAAKKMFAAEQITGADATIVDTHHIDEFVAAVRAYRSVSGDMLADVCIHSINHSGESLSLNPLVLVGKEISAPLAWFAADVLDAKFEFDPIRKGKTVEIRIYNPTPFKLGINATYMGEVIDDEPVAP